MPKGRKLLGWSITLISQLWAAAALAQATPAGTAETTAPAATAKLGEEITITGSRIRRKDLTTPAPVTVVSREQVQASGKVSIGEFLQSLPEQGSATNTSVNNGGDGSTRINLRNLGTARTLVLVNGRRMVPSGTGADDSVDLNSIPTSAIERIEILKDGASSVYGSDAISGVVNIITRKKYDGAEVNAYFGVSTHGDGTTYDLSGTTGTSSDRGSLMFNVGFYKQNTVWAGDRDWSAVPKGYTATGNGNALSTAANPIIGEYRYPNSSNGINPVFTLPFKAGVTQPLTGDPVLDAKINFYNQLVTKFPTTTKFVLDPAAGWRPALTNRLPQDGGDGYNAAPQNYLITPQQRITLFSTGDYKLADWARVYYEASFVNRYSQIKLAAEPFFGGTYDFDTTISKNSIYNPFGVDITIANKRLLDFGNRIHDIEINTLRTVVGVDGTLPDSTGPLKGWFYDLALNFGRTMGTEVDRGSLLLPNVATAVGPSFVDPVNGPTCGTVANPLSQATCVPLNLLGGPGAITRDQVKNLTYAGPIYGTNQMLQLTANTSGELVTLPTADRPVGLALGYEFRRLLGSFDPDPIAAAGFSTNGVNSPTTGGYRAHEAYAELAIPILSRMPFAEALEVTASARYFSYDVFGSDWTYKLGARWTPVRDVTLRGTYSTAYRAPSIGELFSGQADNFANVQDPCAVAATAPASCGAAAGNGDDRTQLKSKIGGNPTVKPETATIYTAGLVLEPRWVKNLTFTADYYNIDITNAIQQLGESVILAGCYPSSGPSKYCDLITRDSTTNQISRIINTKQNAGGTKTSGVDFAIRYAVPTADYGRFQFLLDATWLKNLDVIQADGTVVTARGNYDFASQGTGGQGGVLPAWKANAGLRWGLGGLNTGASMRFVGSFKECGAPNGDFKGSGVCAFDSTYQRQVDAYATFDLFGSYNFKTPYGRTTLGAGINNVFDKSPSRIYNGFTSASDPTAYDFMGRFFYVRLSQAI